MYRALYSRIGFCPVQGGPSGCSDTQPSVEAASSARAGSWPMCTCTAGTGQRISRWVTRPGPETAAEHCGRWCQVPLRLFLYIHLLCDPGMSRSNVYLGCLMDGPTDLLCLITGIHMTLRISPNDTDSPNVKWKQSVPLASLCIPTTLQLAGIKECPPARGSSSYSPSTTVIQQRGNKTDLLLIVLVVLY